MEKIDEDTREWYLGKIEFYEDKPARKEFWEGEWKKILAGAQGKIGAPRVKDSGQCPKGSR